MVVNRITTMGARGGGGARGGAGGFGGLSGNTYKGVSSSRKGWNQAQKDAFAAMTNPNGPYKYPKAYAAKAVNANKDFYGGNGEGVDLPF